ncbi:TIGR03943 family putative permease subunit [Tsukamurella spumae]|uniref:TIGR03943 family protein n=1 Tax=Tsukamurella spumae TaxID=44753 RepID=A0A846X1W5_9ACTN|nr:TIGR03943 family protein [Tsukamurella spumae]NKY18566.1 TIGR03943 family protein [Tsukamurella spumae]
MNRPARNLLLLLFGSAVAIATATGTYLNYVRPVMFWFLAASAVVVVVLAVGGMAADIAEVRADEEDEEFDDAHGHGHGSGRIGWVLLVPVLLLLFCAPPALDPGTAQRTVVVAATTDEPGRAYPPLPPGDAPRIALNDFQNRAVSDTAGTLDRDVTMTAYVTHIDGRPFLTRIMIWCCVADARPIEIEIEGAPALPPDGTWVTAVARLVPGTATRARHYRPIVRLVSAHPVPPPSPPYDS